MTETYRAAFLTGPQQLEFGDLSIPPIGSTDALVRIHRANLCPTDLKKYYHLDEKSLAALQQNGPVILGHEAAGSVAAVGAGVKNLKPGTPVAIDPMLPCGRCVYCQSGDTPMCLNLRGVGVSAGSVRDSQQLLEQGIGGMFAEYVKVPAANLYPLPDGLSFEAGAMMEPLADVVHSLEAGQPTPGETAVVFGLGAMGLMHVQAMHAAGVEKIIGIDPMVERREKSLKFGAYQAIDPSQVDPVAAIQELTQGLGADVIFVCAGGSAQKTCAAQSLQSIRKKGRILLFASALKPADIPVDINHIHYNMIHLTGTVGFYPCHAERALELLLEEKIDYRSLRTPSLPLEKLTEAFGLHSRSEVVKVGVDIWDG